MPGDIFVQEVPQSTQLPDLYEAGIAELQQGLEKGHFTSVDLIKAYLARIEEVNLNGAALHAVIETNPQALSQAAALDAERKNNGSRGPLPQEETLNLGRRPGDQFRYHRDVDRSTNVGPY
ncbi:hypothetical protein PAXINDRAFT_102931 [Paxillus involutus ATCC 200175]|uniref:Unplaced genomic scaffold PAXINscaffold_543, whole genome shotgun sequence n=1 Tax=Paxillus involutus ATCC 200175 TaxID=664439 RepID=A0A0C9SN92_PAXIN|nr:hypothetical protein PAXINDRAFT_102931 [Paxillus involutus ATCC 200175]